MSDKNKTKNWHTETELVRAGTMRSNFGETSEALFLNSGFVYDSAQTAEKRFNGEEPGFVYSRYSNPTIAMLEERLATLEKADKCVAVASGMAAVFVSIMSKIRPGEHLIASRALFGSCYYIATQVLPRFGIEVSLIDGRDNKLWKKSFRNNTSFVFIESPSNPNLEIIDIEFVASLCKEHNATFIVDNIFASPLLQSPLKFGADVVVYSTTKHIDGQGRCLGGAILGSESYINDYVMPFHRHTGTALSPFNAWVALKGLETLSIRMERHCQNAMKIATFLESHDKIGRIFYPHLPSHPQYELAKKQMKAGGNMIAFELKGNKEEVFAFLNKLNIIDISNNLGDTKSLITHPATTTHSNISKDEQIILDIKEQTLRLSVGLEHVDDLIEDIKQAL